MPATPWRVCCDDAELAVECARLSAPLGLRVEPDIHEDAMTRAAKAVDGPAPVALALSRAPGARELVSLAVRARDVGRVVPLALVCEPADRREALWLGRDLGLATVAEIRPLLASMALIAAGARHPHHASPRALGPLDRVRLGGDALMSGRGGGRLTRADEGRLAWVARSDAAPVVLGEPRDVGEALRSLRLAHEAHPPRRAVIEGVDLEAVKEVLFGPPRALSDPASKNALEPFGLPLPLEELCSSPSRAASEAARIGFPVRIALASPDLRIWDHPDLAVDGVDNAARVRDVYRQIMALAHERQPDARLLGVSVTATTSVQALLRVTAEPLAEGFVLADIGFADPHGRAAADRTRTILPTTSEGLERVLGRLKGRELLLAGSAAHRRAVLGALSDVLLRLAAFVDIERGEVKGVELNPVAVLVGGAVEIREACVTVSDAFVRSMQAPRAARG